MIEVENLSLTYRSSGSAASTQQAVNGVSFRVERGQFYTLLGPSGCGKTTTLRCIAGLERPDAGVIRVEGKAVSSSATGEWVPPDRREIGMVFQSYAIWPHMTVFENAAFPLRYGEARLSAAVIRERVRKVLEMVQLQDYIDRPAPHLSGGQQQRLALARAFVMEPKVLLLDEPLSNLDAKLREEMRGELRRLVKSMGITTVFVTHEQIEALTLSDVVAVMNRGVIVQEGGPLEMYRNPASPFVANFIGQSNLLPATVVTCEGASGERTVRVDSALGSLTCTARRELAVGEAIVVAIRPEHVEAHRADEAADNVLDAVLDSSSFVGNSMDCTFRVGGQVLKVMLHLERTPAAGAALKLRVATRHCLALPA
jgi:iron(III) transport system ATP-binding protein